MRRAHPATPRGGAPGCGLAAWAVRASFARDGVQVTSSATTEGTIAASAAAVTFVLVNHALLAQMLRLAYGYDLSASGLFTLDGLIRTASSARPARHRQPARTEFARARRLG